jgi:hypothetical protein
MTTSSMDIDRLVKFGPVVERARELCEPLPPLPDDFIRRMDREDERPEPPPEPHQPGSYERSLEQCVTGRIAEAVAEERERAQEFVIEVLAAVVAPLQKKIDALELELLEVRGIVHEQNLIIKGHRKPRVRVKCEGEWREAWRPPNRQFGLMDATKWIDEGFADGRAAAG